MTNHGSANRIERWLFTLSIVTCGFIYGFLSHAVRLPPYNFLRQATMEGVAFFEPPGFTDPRDDPKSRIVSSHKNGKDSFTLIASFWPDDDNWESGVRLISSSGKVRHKWDIPHDQIFQRTDSTTRPFPAWSNIQTLHSSRHHIHGLVLTPDGNIIFNVPHEGIVKVDACGTLKWQRQNGAHHSIEPAGDSAYWVPKDRYWTEAERQSLRGRYPGLSAPLRVDKILKVAQNGNAVDSINVLDLLYENGLAPRIFQANRYDTDDVTHLNDVEELPANLAGEYPLFEGGDLLLSLRNLSLIAVIDPTTTDVKWVEDDYFVRQHDPDFIGGGWIGVYDNRTDFSENGSVLGGSRIVGVQPHTDSVRSIYKGEFYSRYLGSWQKLSNRRLLVVEATKGRVFRVTPGGSVTWQWYSASYGPDKGRGVHVSEARQYGQDELRPSSWPCVRSG